MLLIEKQLKSNVFAQIVRTDVMSLDNAVVVKHRYELRLKQQKSLEDRNGLNSNRIGSFSSYGVYDSFNDAKTAFKKRWGGWGESALRGDALKAWKNKQQKHKQQQSKQSRPQSKLEVVVSQSVEVKEEIKEEIIISVPKPEKVKKEKPEGIIKTSIKDIEGLDRQQAVDFLTSQRLHKSAVSRIVNQVYGKSKPEPKQKPVKGTSKSKKTQSPKKTSRPVPMTLVDRLQAMRDEDWGGYRDKVGVPYDAAYDIYFGRIPVKDRVKVA